MLSANRSRKMRKKKTPLLPLPGEKTLSQTLSYVASSYNFKYQLFFLSLVINKKKDLPLDLFLKKKKKKERN
jgi:hypothetical protein